jgi:lipoprotein-anchoring transpeptidase ErfK/SrfK
MNRRGKVLLTAAVALPMLLGGAGTAYAAHYQDRALPGSAVAGASVAGLTRDEVAAVVRERADAVTVTLTSAGERRTEHLADLGYSVDVTATVDAVFAANGSWSSYATSLVSPRDVEAVVRADAARTDAVVGELVARAGAEGRPARVGLSPSRTGFVVTPAVPGRTVTPAFAEAVTAAARDLTSTTTAVEFTETDPEVTTAAAQEVADAANALVKRPVVVSDGARTHKASAREKASWLTIPVVDGRPGAPAVDAERVREWVDGLARSLDRAPTDGLRNLGPDGTVYAVVTQAQDGRATANAGDVAADATRALAAGKGYRGSFRFDALPATWTDRVLAAGAENLAYPATEGEKWIDVNLGRHTMTAYVGGTPVYGPVAMVNGADATPTVTGTYRIYSKSPSMTMRGNNADGSRYETPDVPWVSFFTGGYALHGAYWRSTFGYSGSHGCVNLPVGVAKWVYDFAPIGTPVVSHY